MTEHDRRSAAEAILSIPFFDMLMDEIEQAAINACVNAPNTDHDARQANAAEVRAIRRVRSRLAAISKEGQAEPSSRKAPA